MRAAQKLLGAPTIGGGSAQAGGVVEGVKGVKYTPKPPTMYENGEKRAVFCTYFKKLLISQFFTEKYLSRYTPETFFEEYMNFNIFCYLRRC